MVIAIGKGWRVGRLSPEGEASDRLLMDVTGPVWVRVFAARCCTHTVSQEIVQIFESVHEYRG